MPSSPQTVTIGGLPAATLPLSGTEVLAGWQSGHSVAVPSTSFQPIDASLTSIAGLTLAVNKILYTDTPNTFALANITAYGRSLIDDADAPSARTTLGLGGAATLAVGTATGTVAAGDDGRFNKTDFITGLELVYVGAAAVTIGTGAASLSSGAVLNVPTALAKASISLVASTMYHVYLFLNGAAADVEFVTTAPASPYFGNARAKTGDATRRYLGSVVTDGASALLPFTHDASLGSYEYRNNVSASPNRVVNNATGTSVVNVSVAGLVPVSAKRTMFRLLNQSTTVADGKFTEVGQTNVLRTCGASRDFTTDISTPSQQTSYQLSAIPTTGGLFADILGYYFQR